MDPLAWDDPASPRRGGQGVARGVDDHAAPRPGQRHSISPALDGLTDARRQRRVITARTRCLHDGGCTRVVHAPNARLGRCAHARLAQTGRPRPSSTLRRPTSPQLLRCVPRLLRAVPRPPSLSRGVFRVRHAHPRWQMGSGEPDSAVASPLCGARSARASSAEPSKVNSGSLTVLRRLRRGRTPLLIPPRILPRGTRTPVATTAFGYSESIAAATSPVAASGIAVAASSITSSQASGISRVHASPLPTGKNGSRLR